MPSYNRVILVGNLTRDPDVRKISSDDLVAARFSIAMNRSFIMKNGERKDEVTFVDIEAYGHCAKAIGRYFRKGNAILVEGRLHLDQWEDRMTGEKRSRLGVVLESFAFVDRPLGNGQSFPGENENGVPAFRGVPANPPSNDGAPF